MLCQHSQAVHVDASRPGRLEDVGSHRAGSNDIAANALRGVERAGVLCQTDQTVLAGGVCGAYGEVLSVRVCRCGRLD